MEAEPSSSHTLIHCSGAVCTDTLQRKFSLWRLLQSHSLSLILLPSSSRVLVSISFPSLFFSFRSISFLPSFAPYLLVSLSLSLSPVLRLRPYLLRNFRCPLSRLLRCWRREPAITSSLYLRGFVSRGLASLLLAHVMGIE